MKNKYNLLFKTGDAEIRALEKSNFDTDKIFPIIELTRGRKSKYDKTGLISKRIKKIANIFPDETICLDLTADDNLSNREIDNLYSSDDGYHEWFNYIKKLKDDEIFEDIVPTLLVDTSDDNLISNLNTQVKNLSNICKSIAYRNIITDEGYYDDLTSIAQYVNQKNDLKFYFILDCEYVPSGATNNIVELAVARINKVKRLISKASIIIVSTSFPRYVSDIGNDDTDIFPLNEIKLFDGVKNKLKMHIKDLHYGDYGSINPIRNDNIVMTRGWVPRIDVPTLSGIYYHRIRKKDNDYSTTYTYVAQKVVKDNRFPREYKDNWGKRQIRSCSNGSSPGSSPSFWISVRMSLFIAMQLKRD